MDVRAGDRLWSAAAEQLQVVPEVLPRGGAREDEARAVRKPGGTQVADVIAGRVAGSAIGGFGVIALALSR